MEIRNWKTGDIIYQAEADTIKELVVKAVKEHVSLAYADLRCADLSGADLRNADFCGAHISSANLEGADLSGANLEFAYLNGINLEGANLEDADLVYADLGDANLGDANLLFADLSGANLRYALLCGANLNDADLRNAKNVPGNLPMACPTDGSFIAWKKVEGRLVKLEITADAKRSSATTNKCRCSKAKVLAITDLDGTNPIDEVINFNHGITTYRVGEMVYPDSFDDNRWKECSNGIHFFMDKQDAINY